MPVASILVVDDSAEWRQENDADIRAEALAAGADGYILKINAQSELVTTIVAVLSNGHRPC